MCQLEGVVGKARKTGLCVDLKDFAPDSVGSWEHHAKWA